MNRSFEPFGLDFSGALGQGVFLRFPGQWVDGTWAVGPGSASLSSNVHRWYAPNIGTYNKPDPAGLIRSNLGLYSYSLRNPIRFVDPYGLTTCEIVTMNNAFKLGGTSFSFSTHASLLISNSCRSSGGCQDGPGPLLYDPAGGYSAQVPDTGSLEVLNRDIPGWSLGGFLDYHCDSGDDSVEAFCFDTNCCEKERIAGNIFSGGSTQGGLCAVGVGGSVKGVGPFSSLGPTATPAILHRAMNRLLQKHSGSGAFFWKYSCP